MGGMLGSDVQCPAAWRRRSPSPPDLDVLVAGKCCDSNWLREALTQLKLAPRIPGQANRKAPITL